jgi:hypothetical protein
MHTAGQLVRAGLAPRGYRRAPQGAFKLAAGEGDGSYASTFLAQGAAISRRDRLERERGGSGVDGVRTLRRAWCVPVCVRAAHTLARALPAVSNGTHIALARYFGSVCLQGSGPSSGFLRRLRAHSCVHWLHRGTKAIVCARFVSTRVN